MKFGVEKKDEEFVCSNCFKAVNVETQNFCSQCGNPLKKTAVELYLERENNVKLVVLGEVIQFIEDKDALLDIKNMIKNLSEC